MSNDLNHCSFIGRLGRDPETRFMPNGDAVTNFSIAVGESWKDKDSGEKKETVEWVRCTAWRKLGEICGEYLKKGSQVFVSGKMKTRKYQDKEGNERSTTEIIVERMQMLGGKPKEGEAPAEREERPAKQAHSGATKERPSGAFDNMDDDVPF